MLSVACPAKVKIPDYEFRIAAIELLQSLGYVKGVHNSVDKYYLRYNIMKVESKSAKDILNQQNCPTLCEILEKL